MTRSQQRLALGRRRVQPALALLPLVDRVLERHPREASSSRASRAAQLLGRPLTT